MKALTIILLVLGGIVLAIGITALQAWILMFVWNFLAGYFGFQAITFWVSVAITILLSLVGKFFKTTVNKE